MTGPPMTGTVFAPMDYGEIPGWAEDDHAAAFAAFREGAGPLLAREQEAAGPRTPPALLRLSAAALAVPHGGMDACAARAFFEAHFRPHRVVHGEGRGLFTGYYEPELPGSRDPCGPFSVPVYRRPPDLVNLVDETERGAKSHGLTHARRTDSGFVPYFTRAEIEQGALHGRGLELFYFADAVDVFFMHIQGSGRVLLPGGAAVRITYDGKNGHPYTSVGQHVLARGLMAREDMTLAALQAWLKADPERGRKVMWQNESFVFFREMPGSAAAPAGAFAIPLSPGRSLAVDTRWHAIGTPVFAAAPGLTHASGKDGQDLHGFFRLMIAQDVGSAIVGPERGDIFFGTGPDAGRQAGATYHEGNFYVLLPAGEQAVHGGP